MSQTADSYKGFSFDLINFRRVFFPGYSQNTLADMAGELSGKHP
jgi:hypothetical protein